MVFAGFDSKTDYTRSFLVSQDDIKTYPFEGYSVEVVFGGNPADTETITFGSKTYTFQATLTNVDGNVHIGASGADTATNLLNAINASGGGTPGTDYAAATTAHPDANADTSNTAASIHLVSQTPLTLTDGTGGDIGFEDWEGNTVTEMQQYATGDWTTTAAQSAAINLVGCRVTGYTPWSGVTGTTITSLSIYNHAGQPQMSALGSFGGTTKWSRTEPLHCFTGAGLAVGVLVGANGGGYIHWTYERDTSNV